ncbi:MAG: FAD-dependent oxidoreductase, partial [Stackebrandtia sp.]
MSVRHVAVIGGGIAGIAAAQRLRELGGPELRITLIEQASRLGGKIRTGELAGLPVETGAESFLVRRPEAVRLAEAVGLGEALLHPTSMPASLIIDGRWRNLPRRTVMGVPATASDVADVLTPVGLDRLNREPAGHGPILGDEDIAVGALVRKHFGDEIVDRLVDPLLGGVYSGRADDLSLAVSIPALAAAARHHDTLAAAVEACLPTTSSGTGRPTESVSAAPKSGHEPAAQASSAPVAPVFGSI